ncbi:glutamine ABC transporter permease [Marivita lacus]|uniref:Glutamine ABC transporter permease n=1 Tax=Marivita lacus TaxID=1323742 RepID=A0ABQ1LG08_9RHOB|nr:amino acid ABC transporter permease [Marivita lacus]GGC23998.1 glutamine ABC transporter permease [Marivita lacus]
MNIDWEIVRESIPLLAEGLVVTLQISAVSAVLGLILGVILGLGALSRSRLIRWLVLAYVDFIRGTPLLIQIFLVFFALPMIGIRFDEFWAGVIALSLNAAAFVAEVVRGGVGSIERGQTEASMAIGMRHRQILVHILLPQAYRQMVPPLTNELISLVKNSSLLSVISVYEITRAGQAIISVNFVPFEIYTLLALYYYVLIKAISWLSARIERKLPAW